MKIKTYIDKVGLVDIRDRKVMMALSRGKEKWFNPGGKVEQGETREQALVREIREELSVEIDPATIQHYGDFEAQAFGKPEGTFVRMHCYTASYTGEPKPSSELEKIEYFSYIDRHRSTAVDLLIFNDLKHKELID